MSAPVRVQLRRSKGWRMPPNTVSVARPTVYGNPFRVGALGVSDAAAAVEKFRRLVSKPDDKQEDRHAFLTPARIRQDLSGKNLACWCPIDAPCHADVLLELANP